MSTRIGITTIVATTTHMELPNNIAVKLEDHASGYLTRDPQFDSYAATSPHIPSSSSPQFDSVFPVIRC